MRLVESKKQQSIRCAKCGCPVDFDGIVDLGEEADPGFQTLAAFRCVVCGHGFVDLMDRSRALVLESRPQPALAAAP